MNTEQSLNKLNLEKGSGLKQWLRTSLPKPKLMIKRILIISHYYVTDNRGGGEVYLHHVAKALVKEGWHVDAVATDNRTPNETLDGVNVFKGRKHLSMLSKKYDLVITQFTEANKAIPAAQKLGIPVAFFVHNDMQPTIDTLSKFTPDITVFNTKWIRDKFDYQDNYYILHPPIYRKEHATTPGDKVTLINLIQIKGVNVLYNMAHMLPRFQFMGVRGGYQKETQLVMRMPNVEIVPNTSNMKEDVWSKTKILLVPSKYESYGMVAAEALCSGIPVIARRQPGLEEALGVAGRYPADMTKIAWANEIKKLQDPVEYAKASELALQQAKSYTPDKDIKGLIEKFKELM